MVCSSACLIIIDHVFVIVFTLAQSHKLGCLTADLQSNGSEAEGKLYKLIMKKEKLTMRFSQIHRRSHSFYHAGINIALIISFKCLSNISREQSFRNENIELTKKASMNVPSTGSTGNITG